MSRTGKWTLFVPQSTTDRSLAQSGHKRDTHIWGMLSTHIRKSDDLEVDFDPGKAKL